MKQGYEAIAQGVVAVLFELDQMATVMQNTDCYTRPAIVNLGYEYIDLSLLYRCPSGLFRFCSNCVGK